MEDVVVVVVVDEVVVVVMFVVFPGGMTSVDGRNWAGPPNPRAINITNVTELVPNGIPTAARDLFFLPRGVIDAITFGSKVATAAPPKKYSNSTTPAVIPTLFCTSVAVAVIPIMELSGNNT